MDVEIDTLVHNGINDSRYAAYDVIDWKTIPCNSLYITAVRMAMRMPAVRMAMRMPAVRMPITTTWKNVFGEVLNWHFFEKDFKKW